MDSLVPDANPLFLGAPERLENVGVYITTQAVPLLNPLNEELDVMRTTLLPDLLKNVVTNWHHGNRVGRLFELGPVFFAGKRAVDGMYVEDLHLGLAMWGEPEDLWQSQSACPLVFQLKSKIESFLTALRITKWEWLQIRSTEVPDFLHPGQAAILVVEGQPVGFAGTLHPLMAEKNKLRVDGCLAELDVQKIMKGQPRVPKFRPISKFPVVERDLAFVMPIDMAAGTIVRELVKSGGPLLKSVDVFDVYKGDNLSEGQKSLAFRLVFQDDAQTLTDEDVNLLRDRMAAAIRDELKVSVR